MQQLLLLLLLLLPQGIVMLSATAGTAAAAAAIVAGPRGDGALAWEQHHTSDRKPQQQQQEDLARHHADPQLPDPDPQLQMHRDRSLRFLLRYLPPMDKGVLPLAQLKENVELAHAAREASRWARAVPLELYHNDVLPHASLDEPRDGWRRMMYSTFMPLVKDAGSLTEAAQILNQKIWKIWGIVFKPEQTPEIMSPSQVIAAGYASCTGLSIFLVNACRSVGIPARVAGTPDWLHPGSAGTRDVGKELALHNHNWVEIWDGTAWSFTGAAEYDPLGFNRSWFFPQPAQGQVPGDRLHAIYASSYQPSSPGTHFPLAWNLETDWVNAEDVTQTYLGEQPRQLGRPEV